MLQRRSSMALPGGGSSPTAAAVAAAGNKHADVYLTELLSYSLDRLRKEPELLAEERQQLERAMQASALTHYRAFIDGAACLGAVRDALSEALARLGRLQEDAPRLGAACGAFSRDAAGALARRAANKQLLTQQAALLELLDAPQLMDTCVRNGIYDEALDLGAFINRMGLLHGELPVVRLLQWQAGEVSALMLAQLLQRLRGSIQVRCGMLLFVMEVERALLFCISSQQPASMQQQSKKAKAQTSGTPPLPRTPVTHRSCPSACASSVTCAAWRCSASLTCGCSFCGVASSGACA